MRNFLLIDFLHPHSKSGSTENETNYVLCGVSGIYADGNKEVKQGQPAEAVAFGGSPCFLFTN
ncbi:hypothetical protein MU1_41860 [Paenibacillus glycanilyticus]|uniref:Uncharacterized protein n=1 Tax=Paenibacillus glycanilyticus TaxID=126569 RepID=A0ABQ6GH62_9BACL|nr:hypothetical protein MU1_41860 [Paenibacillus glycanilyticus]